MEKKIDPEHIPENEFLKLVAGVKHGDEDSMTRIIEMFEEDMRILSRYIPMPKEDALQSMKLELIELIKNSTLYDEEESNEKKGSEEKE
ncbi:hypothetical protein PUW24_09355 [Paenibacillus urinalis]|uniref:Helix-turn-helix conjugative transposon-like domain-containing protein n=1 Tax=Paenibacillus urinalis TaxID=521520 RepID=A0AAX3N118_9BACL|nr:MULTISPECIES: hypothetical protein [Paenibacillus]WDH83003.1 hypothetical protein PUW23_01800 [Paenibacillus urinalis]WDH99057.1 hypothetical protein PUW24_09355 [Paenibacillus urinalis]WDI02748.1 hypothetical protein PUW25_01805 [Paenibacillus urinalis]GAK40236.1 hypothetical protein TCA2_2726 [Paenibacillus sp. TCA20]